MLWGLLVGSAPLPLTEELELVTPAAGDYGPPSAPPRRGRLGGADVVVLARHGEHQDIPPHLVNYRANIDLLCTLGVGGVIALNTVGGIHADARAGTLVVPHQLIDYTWGRDHTFSTAGQRLHADFAEPFDDTLRLGLVAAARSAGVDVRAHGVYGCTQGPRFETAAEIDRLARDGCDLVGMTAMPEAALARERGLPYAALSLVVNPAAGRAADPFDLAAIAEVAAQGAALVERLLLAFFESRPGR
jgi:5'-methylthioinosine phosphorylase